MTFITLYETESGETIINTDSINQVFHQSRDEAPKYPYIVYMDSTSERISEKEYQRLSALLAPETPSQVSDKPTWNKGVNTLAFSKLMHQWYLKRNTVDIEQGLTTIQAEKDAYSDVLDYIAKIQPTLPADVIAAWKKANAVTVESSGGLDAWDLAMTSVFDALGAHMSQEGSDE